MKVSTKQLPPILTKVMVAGLVPMVHGSPGIGKSDIIRAIAKKNNLKVIDVRLSQCDPTDLNGLPTRNGNKAAYLPMDTFPVKGDKVPNGYNGWILFMDEMNSAPMSVQAAAYKIILDRMVGQFELHQDIAICAAGNLTSDKAIVNRMSTAMQSRMIHFSLELLPEDWISWANDSEIDYRVISFINFRPDLLHKFDPKHNDMTFACPRTWEFASKLMIKEPVISGNMLPVLSGALSEGIAREFTSFTNIFDKLATVKEIILRPKDIPLSSEPAVQYAYTGHLANNITDKNIDKLLPFITRLPIEFQILTMVPSIKKNPALDIHPAVIDWKTQYLHPIV